MKKHLLLFFIIILAVFLRFWQLGNNPIGITNDEAGHVYSAYSIWKTGHDVAGKFLPLSINLDNSFSPAYIYLNAPFVGMMGLSVLSGRIMYALVGVLTVLVLYLLVRKLTYNEYIALLSAFVMSISPWHIQLSRGAWDANIALFFFLLSTYVFVLNLKKGSILYSLPFFLLAFYSYHATKVFFIFYPLVLIIVFREKLLAKRLQLGIFLIGIIAIALSFVYILKTQNVTRQKVILPNLNQASKVINSEREKNLAPLYISQFFNNKVLYYVRVFRENYLEAFSPQYLFLYGETSGVGGTYSMHRGVLYIIELPLLLIGIYYLLKNKESSFRNLIILSLLIAPLPSTFTNDRSYFMRSSMMLPFLSVLVAYGIYYFIHIIKKQKNYIYYTSLIIFASFYTFLFISYLYQYYLRYPVYGAEYWLRSSRDLSIYIGERKNDFKNIYVTNAGSMFLLQYGIFNKVDSSIMQKAWQSNPRKLDNITFVELGCGFFDLYKDDKKNNMFIVPDDCHRESTPSAKIKDLGEPLRTIWKIYEYK